MVRRSRWLAGAVAGFLVVGGIGAIGGAARAAGPAGATASDPGQRWWAHVRYLADDKLEGRLTGSEGYRKAAEYVAQHFKEYGLAPAGSNGYLQPVRFSVQLVKADQSRLVLVHGGTEEPLALGEDATLGSRLPQPKALEAPLVFVGYGLHLPAANHDDFAGKDLRGKVLVYINGGPAAISGPLRAHARAAAQFYSAVEQTGALGTITIPNPKAMDIPWSRAALAASQPGMWIADSDLQDVHRPMFTATWNPAHAEKLFAGSGHTIAELLALASASKPMPGFALPATVRARIVTATDQVESPNVAAVLPGSDPRLKGEYVVLSAHLDHLGVGRPINGDPIYNGAMDNASGVASLLEIARALHESGHKIRRSLLFLAVCGEEKGLLGSRYFVHHPTVARQAMVADLNMDMFLPLFPLRLLTVQGVGESSLGDEAREVARTVGVEVVADRQPDRQLFIRSDQYNFIVQGVPALAFSFGSAPGSSEERQLADWLTHRYHAPSDDTNQPVDLAAAVRFNGLLLKLAEQVANQEAKPAWKPASFFRRFAQPGATR